MVITTSFVCATSEEAEARALSSVAHKDMATVNGLYNQGLLFHVEKGTVGYFLVSGLSDVLGDVLLQSGEHVGQKCWIPKAVLKLKT